MHLGLQHLSTVSSRTSPHRPPQLCRRQLPRLAVQAQGQVKSPSRLTLDHVEISYFCFYWGYSWGALCSLRCISHYSWVYPLTHVICSLLVQPCASKDAQAARLRRLCEKKPSGRCHVPQHIHELWVQGGTKRDELQAMFTEVGENKDALNNITKPSKPMLMFKFQHPYIQYPKGPCCLQELFINTVTKTLERKNSKEQEVQSGWFTPEEMAHTFGLVKEPSLG